MNKTDHTSTIALITGGTQGLGLAVADELVASGCRQIVLAGRSKEKGAAAKAQLEAAGAEVYFHSCDISIA
ncbi:MAG: ribosomal protein L7/L12, partial [Candidatus Puniceispirillaceae bacterium]